MEPIAEVKQLHKSIRRKKILDGVSFQCHAGEIFGLLGRNGSGKTTLFQLMLGLARPDEGEIWINGIDALRHPAAALHPVGATLKNPEFYPFLTGRQNLQLFARMHAALPPGRVDEVLALTGLTEHSGRRLSHYSLGQRQKLGLAQAILHRPKLLILDEPANGLDPAGIRKLRDILKELAHKERMGVLLSCRQRDQIELLCDRASALEQGRLNVLPDWAGSAPKAAGPMGFRFVASPMDTARRIAEESGLGILLEETQDHLDLRLTAGELTAFNRLLIQNNVRLHTVSPLEGAGMEDAWPLEEEGADGGV